MLSILQKKEYLKLLSALALMACFFISCVNVFKNNTDRKILVFHDTGKDNWKDKWMVDGLKSSVINSKNGMELIAGPVFGDDASHTVLWTKQTFKGDICIEYDYTRTDTTTRAVNILYFHATGKGDKNYPKDISLWKHKRNIPKMSLYFNNMDTYHISYAAFSAKEYSGDNDYIRLRRYNPNIKGLDGTNFSGDYFNTGLFKTGVTYHIKVVKYKDEVTMQIKNITDINDSLICKWNISQFPIYNEGRIGLRHMYTRKAIYKNFKVWELK